MEMQIGRKLNRIFLKKRNKNYKNKKKKENKKKFIKLNKD